MKKILWMAGLALAWNMAAAAQAQSALPPGVVFGMPVDAVRQALPALDLVRRPQRLAGGLAGSWQLPQTQVAGLSGSQTFFFAGGVLRRVEFSADAQAVADGGAAAFEQLLDWGRTRYGAERPAQDAVSRYAAWSTPGQDVYVRLTSAPHAGLQLVLSARLERDDRAL